MIQVSRLRELIAVSPRVEALLRAFAQTHPESERGIEKMLAYRRRVSEEFERLLSGVTLLQLPRKIK